MKNIIFRFTLLFLVGTLLSAPLFSQGVAINTTGNPAHASAMLDVQSISSGMLLPRLSLLQRGNISSPANGLVIYQTDNNPGFYYFNGSTWARVGDGYGTVTSISTGNGITGGPITTTGTLGLTGQALALHNVNINGFFYRNGGTIGTRTMAVSGNGIGILYGDGASGNPTISLNIGTGSTQVAAGNHTHEASHVITGEFDRARVRRMISADTRATNPNPEDYEPSLQADFKTNTIDGLIDGGTYHGVLSFRPYGSAADYSGGPMHQLGFTQNGSLWMRTSSGSTTWDSWKQLANASSISGNINYVAKFTSPNSLGNSQLFDNGTNVGVGMTGPTYKLHVAGDIYANGGWMRVSGDNGLYFESWGGGFYMTDATWIRTYNNKSFYQNTGILRTDGTFQVGSDGSTLNVPNSGNFAYRTNVLFANTSGNVGIGTASPTEKLSINGAITTQNGKVKRDFAVWNTTTSSNDPIHIKTNITWSNIMYRILVEGYNYGAALPINSEIVGYTYSPTPAAPISANAINHAGGASISQYKSDDGYLVIKLTTTSTFYFVGFSVSAWLTNPAGNAFDIKALEIVQQANDMIAYVPGSQTFSYTGAQQTFTVPAGVTSIAIDACGGSGSTGGNGIAGKGGRVQTTLSVTPGEILNIYVGGQATSNIAPGYNGGATGSSSYSLNGAGGGASDIRRGGTALANRILVAGGGGGTGYNWSSSPCDDGGIGGGTTGGRNSPCAYECTGYGGTQSGGGAGGSYSGYSSGGTGSLGNGGAGTSGTGGGGGGGGYYGGGGGSWGGGGGGSSYPSSASHTQGYKTGNGQVIISW